MKGYYALLFYYSGALTTLLILELIFSFPPPQSIILLLLFLPVPLFFAFKLKTEAISMRLSSASLTVVIIIVAGFLVHSTVKNLYSPVQNSLKLEQEISDELKKIKEELKASSDDMKEQDKAVLEELGALKEDILSFKKEFRGRDNILGFATTLPDLSSENSSISPAGFIRIKDNAWQSVDVFEEKNSSKVIGKAFYGKTYPYFLKEDNYYYVELSESTNGWIGSRFIEELPK